MGIAEWKNNRARLERHVLPILGNTPIDELFKELRKKRALAPKTIRNIYSAVQGMFREAAVAGLVDASPCILTEHHLGAIEDKELHLKPGAETGRQRDVEFQLAKTYAEEAIAEGVQSRTMVALGWQMTRKWANLPSFQTLFRGKNARDWMSRSMHQQNRHVRWAFGRLYPGTLFKEATLLPVTPLSPEGQEVVLRLTDMTKLK